MKLSRIADVFKINLKQSVSANYIIYRCCGLLLKLSKIADVCRHEQLVSADYTRSKEDIGMGSSKIEGEWLNNT